MNRGMFQAILRADPVAWVTAGFLVSYLCFFIAPIFLSGATMDFFQYVPRIVPIGADLRGAISYSEAWLVYGTTPYIGSNLYPPLTAILFGPLLAIDFASAFALVTLVNVTLFAIATFAMPLKMATNKNTGAMAALIFASGAFSYGLQFEIERGQFNLIAAFLCFTAIYIYHRHRRFRAIAYLLFVLSVQMKVFTFIFILMLLPQEGGWRAIARRVFVLSAINGLFLFILGPQIFLDFIAAIRAQIESPYVWQGNHSIRSFVTLITIYASDHGFDWVNAYAATARIILFVLTLFFIGFTAWRAYRENNLASPYLFCACTLGALLIPSVSHDYKLSILAAPVSVLLASISRPQERSIGHKALCAAAIFVFSAAYSSTLFSYTNKPLFVYCNFPALMTMLSVIALLSWCLPARPLPPASE